MNKIHCINIFGLLLQSNRSKSTILGDMLVRDNSLITFVTETWLDNTVEDAEILIPGFTVYRGDRVGRKRGGSICHLYA